MLEYEKVYKKNAKNTDILIASFSSFQVLNTLR